MGLLLFTLVANPPIIYLSGGRSAAGTDITALTAFPRNCLSRHQLLLEGEDEDFVLDHFAHCHYYQLDDLCF